MSGAGGVIRGDIANLYQVRGGLLKMARDPADNDLMRREATALTRLQDMVDPALLAYFPPLVATGRRDEARSGIRRHVNLIGALSGFRSLAEVRTAFPAGVDPRDAAWMWRRLLVAIGAAHRAGVIHGAVLPEHVLIHPAEHCRPRETNIVRRTTMGSGRWSTNVYDAAARFRAATGASAFAYSDGGATRVHPALDPFGVTVRESRDSAEHPRSLAIAVLFDVTGSMRGVPRVLQAKLPQLLGLLLRKGYTADPQIMFGAIGDATCDRAPLQAGQFESDNRMDDDLGRILLEGGGGGQKTESYELALYFMARHTAIDCYSKRGRRGYLFVIGDEMAYPQVKPAEVRDVIGGGLQAPLPLPALIDEVTAKWDTYYILPAGASYVGDRQVLGFWHDLLGQNVIQLADLDAVCETIALTVGLGEDAVNLDGGLADLDDVGSAAGPAVRHALASIGSGRRVLELAPPDLTVLDTTVLDTTGPEDLDGQGGNVRL